MTFFIPLLFVAMLHAPAMSQDMTHEAHLKKMHGDAAMGFDQDKIDHHFRASESGGTIEVDAKDPRDAATIAQIRAHLQEITKAFATGDFSKPLLTHGEQPPGVPVLQQRKRDITYRYEERAAGGLVRITTANREALEAVHIFLDYQTREHHAK